MSQLILGFLLADVVGGTGHWFEDSYLHYCTTIPGLKEIARQNEMHHYFPRSMLNYSYFENVKESFVLVFILFLVLFVLFRKNMAQYPVFFASFLGLLSLTNLFHRFSHQRECENNAIILFLQKNGVLCSHEHHRRHHVDQVDGKYCTIFPFSNFILDHSHFWRFLEKIIGLFGVEPDRKPNYESYAPIQNYMHENAKKKCPPRPNVNDLDLLYQNLDHYIVC